MPRFARIPAFAAIISMLLAGLLFINWLPRQLEEQSVRPWRSIEDARRKLDLPPLKLPAFFPATLRFPASEVWAGTKPGPTVLMHFGLSDHERLGLAILWSTADSEPIPPRMVPSRILDEKKVDLEEISARFELAACADGRPCNRLRWSQKGWSITLIGSISEKQLIRIGHSMLER